MNRLRTNTIRLIAIAAICFGFGLYMMQQTQANHSSQAFANWLDSKIGTVDGKALQRELDDLQKSDDHHLDKMIKEASKIVKTNNKNFEFSFGESTVPVHIYQLLLIEWSQFQTGNAMAGIPMPPAAKAIISVVLDYKAPMGIDGVFSKMPAVFGTIDILTLESDQLFVDALQPMTEGIAIGAP